MQNNTFSGLFVGQNIVRLKRVDSTNDQLKHQLSNSAPLPEGTVILADEQTSGRGQQSNVWHSQAGKNLTFSILLKPSFLTIAQQFLLNKAISIAINDVLLNIIGDAAKIKWPNDMYAVDKKIGGMLIENIIQGAKWKYAIIGIGLNVNQDDFPPALDRASSISKILHSHYDLEVLLSQLCNHIEVWYLKLKGGKIKEIEQAYISRLYKFNQEGLYSSEGEVFKARLVNVSPEGLLQLDTGDRLLDFNIKEVAFLN